MFAVSIRVLDIWDRTYISNLTQKSKQMFLVLRYTVCMYACIYIYIIRINTI